MHDSNPPLSVSKGNGLVIECDVCRTRAALYISESDEFHQHPWMERYCGKCGVKTLWRQNKRRERRLRLNMIACVRFRGVGEEVLVTEDVSRGGLCFESRQYFVEGTRIEIAAPYTHGGINIFSDYRILAVQKPGNGKLTRYHAMHVGLALAS